METLFAVVSTLLIGMIVIWAGTFIVEPTNGIFFTAANATAIALNQTAEPAVYSPDYTVLFALPVLAVFITIYLANQKKKEEEAYHNANAPVY